MLFVLSLILILMCLLYVHTSSKKPHNFPPGPFWYPFTGCIKELGEISRKLGGQHKAFNFMSKQYESNIIGLKLGNRKVVVVLSYPLVKQILCSEDYDGRPNDFFLRLRSMGQKIGITSADGELWLIQRTFVMKHMRQLGFGKETIERMVHEELEELLLTFEYSNKTAVQVGPILSMSVLSILWRLVAGSRLPKDDTRLQDMFKLLKIRQSAFDMAGGRLNMFPWLRFIAPEKTGYNLILRLNEQMRSFFQEIIDKHHEEWNPGRDDDVIHAFISHMKEGNDVHPSFTNDQLLMICIDIFIAGSHTVTYTLEFAFLMIILHPAIQKKIQTEIDNVFEEDHVITYSDRMKVPYVEAVIMEVKRFCHVTPITGPRRTLRDTVLDNYFIPKDTTVLISNYSVHMDKNIWGDPEVFRPERFLDENGKLVTSEKLIPFGLGRRRCPGESLARSYIFLIFVGVLRKYIITNAPNRPKPTGTPIPGITLIPEEYKVMLINRIQKKA
ncbi:probable cytochrome P450 305a1 [Onthophagus taurus]|uniref:probable cytochrome P450 305a1 n=1 Tax=Onthophagus taurus TaxID=166361 RepID=UPI0039BE209A